MNLEMVIAWFTIIFILIFKDMSGEKELRRIRMELEKINKQAIDQVAVVRCKDCKHLTFSDCYGEQRTCTRITQQSITTANNAVSGIRSR